MDLISSTDYTNVDYKSWIIKLFFFYLYFITRFITEAYIKNKKDYQIYNQNLKIKTATAFNFKIFLNYYLKNNLSKCNCDINTLNC